jgi:hypothetical protein
MVNGKTISYQFSTINYFTSTLFAVSVVPVAR